MTHMPHEQSLAEAWLPHPESPAGLAFDWASLGLPHPDSPVGLNQLTPTPSFTAAAPQLHALRPRTPPVPVRPAPPARRAAPRTRAEPAAAPEDTATRWVEFRYVMKGTGLPASDRVACVLTHPSGRREEVPMSKGKVRRDGVESGTYALKPRHLAGVTWSPSSVHAGEEAGIRVSGSNVPDGDMVEIQVYEQHAPEGSPPLQTLQAKFGGGVARAAWTWEQAQGQPPYGGFVARARWRSKSAESGPLAVEAYPASDERGLQQRLKHMGLHGGAIDGAPATTAAALKDLGKAWPFLQDQGVTDSQRRDFIAATTY